MKRTALSLVCGVLLCSSALAQESAQDWYTQGGTLYRQGKYAESADAYHAAIEAGAKSPTVFYNAACSNALAGRTDVAFQRLDEALDHGWRDVEHVKADKDFASLHADPRWARTLQLCTEAREVFMATLKHPELHLELLEMKRIDQAIRSMDHAVADADKPVHGTDMSGVDVRNTARMKEIVAQYGWPTSSMVGEEGATAAWLLVQHADHDPQFQRNCLELMKQVPAGEVSKADVAYLTDRVLVNEGKNQLYGTQFWSPNGKMEPRPIEDEANLDKRRKEVGLSLFAEYAKHMTGPHDH